MNRLQSSRTTDTIADTMGVLPDAIQSSYVAIDDTGQRVS